jgi:quercetin dioxygenase-like cupin family protein
VADVDAAGGVRVTTLLDSRDGCERLEQRRLSLAAGAVLEGQAGRHGECWYVTAGTGQLTAIGQDIGLAPATAVWLPGRAGYRCRSADGLDVVATVVKAAAAGPALRVSRLADCPPERTGDREFRVLLGSGPHGDLLVTQFVGVIPPGRAPLHQHDYDEVVHVLDGHGIAHQPGRDSPIEPGSVLYLPPGQPHCLENPGTGSLRVLGVFYPAGSPAAKRETTNGESDAPA